MGIGEPRCLSVCPHFCCVRGQGPWLRPAYRPTQRWPRPSSALGNSESHLRISDSPPPPVRKVSPSNVVRLPLLATLSSQGPYFYPIGRGRLSLKFYLKFPWHFVENVHLLVKNHLPPLFSLASDHKIRQKNRPGDCFRPPHVLTCPRTCLLPLYSLACLGTVSCGGERYEMKWVHHAKRNIFEGMETGGLLQKLYCTEIVYIFCSRCCSIAP